MTIKKLNKYEFSRLLKLYEFDQAMMERSISANSAECLALAKRFGLVELRILSANLMAERVSDSLLIQVTGSFHADVVQRCVITLEPLVAIVDAYVDELYGPNMGNSEINDTTVDEATPPEPFDGDGIDLGELVAQQLALALDPYPKKNVNVVEKGNSMELPLSSDDISNKPFSLLAAWPRKC